MSLVEPRIYANVRESAKYKTQKPYYLEVSAPNSKPVAVPALGTDSRNSRKSASEIFVIKLI